MGRPNSAPNTSTARLGSESKLSSRAKPRRCDSINSPTRACNPLKGLLCAGNTSTSSGIRRLIIASELSQSLSGSASGSVGYTDTFEEMRGRTWSPEIKSFN